MSNDFEDNLPTAKALAIRLTELVECDNYPVALKATLECLELVGISGGIDLRDGAIIKFDVGNEVTNEQWEAKLNEGTDND